MRISDWSSDVCSSDLAKRTLTKLEKRTPLAQAVEDIHHALINRNEMPHSIMDTVIPETGRIKARRIRLTPEQRRRAEELGFLRTDLSSILTSQYEQDRKSHRLNSSH